MKRVTIASLLIKALFLFFIQAKDGYGYQKCQKRTFRLGVFFLFFLSIYDILIECGRYTWEIRPFYT